MIRQHFEYKGNVLPLGLCGRCGFRGILRAAMQIRPEDVDSITGSYSSEIPQKMVCFECFDTPPGCRSANESHVRLPASAYLEA